MGLYSSVPLRSRLDGLVSSLHRERATFIDHWRLLGDYFQPRRVRMTPTDQNKGDRRNQNIIDSSARYAARTLASGLHAGLTSPARPWMRLTTSDPDLAERSDVRAWLHVVTRRMLAAFQKSNLYQVLPTVYGDMGIFGTAAMVIVDDRRDVFRCYAYPVGSYAVGLDSRGMATTFTRDYQLTVRQVVEQFGLPPGSSTPDWSRISRRVKDHWDKGEYEQPIQVRWVVTPNDDANDRKLEAKYLPWRSCTYELGVEDGREQAILRESGFRRFPAMVPRWDVTGEDSYGTDCPGMTALGDVMQLQTQQREKGKAIAKMVTPPLQAPIEFQRASISSIPGDVTFGDTREGHAIRSLYDVRLDLGALGADIGEVQYRIERAFYADLFLMLSRSDQGRGAQPATAREIEERHEEKLLALGPVLERTSDELLDPIVDRVYEMMARAEAFPPPPESLLGVDLKVEYISIMAQAQKLVGVAALDRYMQTTVAAAGVAPEILHKVDVFAVQDAYADMLGIDPRLTRSTEDAQARFEAQQQQQQAMLAAEQAKQLSTAAAQAGRAPVAPDSALDRLLSNIGATA